MRRITDLIAGTILALWLVVIATFSIQNITPVALKFLVFESAPLPVGVMLTLAVAVGLLLGAIAPLFGPRRSRPSPRVRQRLQRPQPRVEPVFDELDNRVAEPPGPPRNDWDERISKTW